MFTLSPDAAYWLPFHASSLSISLIFSPPFFADYDLPVIFFWLMPSIIFIPFRYFSSFTLISPLRLQAISLILIDYFFIFSAYFLHYCSSLSLLLLLSFLRYWILRFFAFADFLFRAMIFGFFFDAFFVFHFQLPLISFLSLPAFAS